jgi:hypothetical protein
MCAERLQQVVAVLRAEALVGGDVCVVGVGSGNSKAGKSMLSETRLDAKADNLMLLCDEKKVVYRHFDLHRGVRRTFTWMRPENRAGANDFWRVACCAGRVPFVNAGDPWQQGGIFVVSHAGEKMHFSLKETSPGWPQMDDEAFIAAVKKAVKEGGGGGGRSSTSGAAPAAAGAGKV